MYLFICLTWATAQKSDFSVCVLFLNRFLFQSGRGGNGTNIANKTNKNRLSCENHWLQYKMGSF